MEEKEEARGEKKGKWKQLPQASESQPERRQAHTAVGFGGYSVFLFGGHTAQGLCPSDLWFFSCGTLKTLAPFIFVLIVLSSWERRMGGGEGERNSTFSSTQSFLCDSWNIPHHLWRSL